MSMTFPFSVFSVLSRRIQRPKGNRSPEQPRHSCFKIMCHKFGHKKKKNIGVVWLGTEEKCTKRGTPRYKTVMKSMAGINCVSNSKARETPPCSHILRKYACSMPLKLGKQQGKLAVEM